MIHEGDNLPILQSLTNECVDLVYLDPPFNTGRDWKQFDDRWHTDAPQHPVAVAAAQFHSKQMAGYIDFLAPVIVELRRTLKPTGSIFLHCDPTAGAYLKMLMDCVFGKNQFRNEIVWTYTGGTDRSKGFQKKHDAILFYSKTCEFSFNSVYVPYAKSTIARFNKIDSDGRRYKVNTLADGRVTKTYMKANGKLAPDHIHIGIVVKSHSEATSYPTQKPVALLEHIIKASSNEGDTVLDPFCGSGTTCVAAQQLGRNYIGIDQNPEAVEIARRRLSDPRGQ